MNIQIDALLFKEHADHCVVALVDKNERILGHILRVNFAAAVERVTGRINCKETILSEKNVVNSADLRRNCEATIHSPIQNPLADLRVVSLLNLKRYGRVLLAETIENMRQPMHSDAGEGTDANRAIVQVVDGCRFVLKLPVGVDHGMDIRQQRPAVGGQLDAGTIAYQKAHVELRFERADRVADCRLRVVHHVRRPRETAGFNDFKENFKFLNVHVTWPFHQFCSCMS